MRPSASAAPAPAVLVTGGARRLGAAIVRRFAREGWHCVIHHKASIADAEALRDEIVEAGGSASLCQFDLADAQAAQNGLEAVFAEVPQLTALVNSASVFEYDEATLPSPAVWNHALAVNTLAPVLLATTFQRLLAADARACVVNILDQKLSNLNPDFFSYTVSKAALQSASQIMAQALAPKVRVVNVAPGLVLPSGDQTLEEFEKSSLMNLLNRRTTLEDVAGGVFYVATQPYATGQTLYIDSGQSLSPHERDVMFLVRHEKA